MTIDTTINQDGAPLSERQREAALAIFSGKEPGEAQAAYFDLINSDAAKARLAAWRETDEIDPVLAETRHLLLPALLDVESKYVQIERQWPRVFSRRLSKMDTERAAEMRYTGLAQLTSPGARPTRDNAAGERFVYRFDHNNIGLGVSLKPDVAADMKNVPRLAMGLAASFAQTAEVLHASVFNTGFVYNMSLVGDGQPLFSERHPIDDGSYSNVMFDRPLSQATLEDIAVQIAAFPDQASLRINAKPVKLVVPIALQFEAARLAKQMQADNNPAWPGEGIRVLDYLTDQKTWFVTTNIKGLVSFGRAPFRLDLLIEDGCLVLQGTERYVAGHMNPRAVFGILPKGNEADRYAAATDQVATQMRRMSGEAA